MKYVSIRLVQRDKELVLDLFAHGVMRRDDFLGRGHFSSVGRCNHRLLQLANAGILRRIASVNGLVPRQQLYTLGTSAAPLLTASLDLSIDEAKRLCRVDHTPTAIEHSLGILDFRLQLQRESTDQQTEVSEWLAESDCRHEFSIRSASGTAWTRIVVKPDAYFRLDSPGMHSNLFLEVDLGNVSLPRFTQKVKSYDSYISSGAFADAYDADSFHLLTVTVGERRLSSLAAGRPKHFDHLVTTRKRLAEQGIFNAEWTSAEFGAGGLLDHLSRKASGGTR